MAAPLRIRLLRIVVIGLAIPVMFFLGCQSRLIYYPNAYHEGYRKQLQRAGGVRIEHTTAAGKQASFYVPPKGGAGTLPATIWLCFGGNGALALDWLPFVSEWDPRFGYLMIDYPGYGDCQGTPNPARIREASKAAVNALAVHLKTSMDELQTRLAVLGHSIGCAAGLMAADDFRIQRVVLISPFTTMTEMARVVLGRPLCYLNLHRFDNRKHLAKVLEHGARVVIFHGTADEVIPVRMSRELAAAHPGLVALHEKPGQDHNFIVGNISAELGQTMRQVAGLE